MNEEGKSRAGNPPCLSEHLGRPSPLTAWVERPPHRSQEDQWGSPVERSHLSSSLASQSLSKAGKGLVQFLYTKSYS